MAEPASFAEILYRILPAFYRTRDESGDLRAYLEGCGELLDAVYATLRQRHADNFPDNPADGSSTPPAQDWLLPYFAELVDARLVSPLPVGRRDELGMAIRWRQGKGTLAVIDSVAQAIGQTEAVVQEGWRRVALTPRIGQPLRPAVSFGYSREPAAANPGNATRHPDLPAAIVDVRCPSRALAVDEDNPGAQTIEVDGVARIWRQGSWHGAPCFPGAYEDVSRRTVDVCTPDWRVGHAHPRRILAFLPPPSGFFPPAAERVQWRATPSAAYRELVEIDETSPGLIVHRNRTPLPVVVTGNVNLDTAATPATWRFEGLSFERQVRSFSARLEFERCAVQSAITGAADLGLPVLTMTDCLAGQASARDGLARLVGVTVLGRTAARAIEASDCLFAGPIAAAPVGIAPPPDGGCVRYSRIEPGQPQGDLHFFQTTTEAPAFFAAAFGARHVGVLAPASHASILAGAEDEGELGAFHHARHAAIRTAILTKLADFLPVGLEAVLIPDARLTEPPHGA